MIRMMMAAVAVLAMMMAQAPAMAQTTQWKADPVHSSVVFKIQHMGVSHVWGRFNQLEGAYATGDNPRFSFTVRADSVDTGNAKRDDHLRSGDFFNVKQFPVVTFTSTKATPIEGGYEVTGDLTLHGVTKPITVKLMKVGEQEVQGKMRSGFDTSFTIKRSEYGMTNMVGPVGDEVQLHVAIEGIQS